MRFADPQTADPPICTAVTADGLWLVLMESTFSFHTQPQAKPAEPK